MIYIKFASTRADALAEKVVSTKEYSKVSLPEGETRIYYDGDTFDIVSDDAWMNCFVMNENGKTIDVYHSLPRVKENQ